MFKHIIPSRTNALLGQVPVVDPGNSVINEDVNLNDPTFEFGDSNQDHSAQFYESRLRLLFDQCLPLCPSFFASLEIPFR